MDGRGLKKSVSASVLDRGNMIESDHATIRIEIEWEEFGRRMNGKEYENMPEMSSMMAK